MAQRLQHMGLPDHVGEGIRPPFAGEDAVRLHAAIMHPQRKPDDAHARMGGRPLKAKGRRSAPLVTRARRDLKAVLQADLVEVDATVVLRDAGIRVVLVAIAEVVLQALTEAETKADVVAELERGTHLLGSLIRTLENRCTPMPASTYGAMLPESEP